MFDHKDGDALFAKTDYDVHHLSDLRGGESRHRLVKQQQLRFGGEGARYFEPFLIADSQTAREAASVFFEET